MIVLLALLTLASAPLQAAVSTALMRDPLAAPVLPVALVAGWAVMRPGDATWPAILLPAVVLGAVSEERVGWFVFALLPAPAIALLGSRQLRPRVAGLWRRLSVAWAAAALGAAAYAVVLALSSGVGGELGERVGALLAAATLTGALAVLAALLFWPIRVRSRSLFG